MTDTEEKKPAAKTSEQIYPYQLPAAFARTHLESLSALEVDSPPYNHRLTNIVTTISPGSNNVELLEKMFEAGCGIVRVNFSHGSHETNKLILETVKMAAIKHWLPIAVAMDLRGPEIRTGTIKGKEDETVDLVQGTTVQVTIDDASKDSCDDKTVWVDFKNLVAMTDVNKKILIDHGSITLVVREKGPFYLKCEVEYGGVLGSKRKVDLPGTEIDLPAISEKDISDLNYAVDNNFDLIFAPSITKAETVRTIKQTLGEKGKRIKIISKITNKEGVKKFNEILEASDGILISRGDLGFDIPSEKVFVAQKMISARTLRSGKPIICSSQLLESMVTKPTATRAEMSDVANAILDSVDCLMLTSETSKGIWPVLSVEMLHSIAKEAECALYHRQLFEELRLLTPKPADVSKTTAISAVESSIESMASCIVVLTFSGRSASLISAYRPRCPILAVTRDEITARQLRIYRGILPVWYRGPKLTPFEKDIDARIQHTLKIAEHKGIVKINNFVVIVHGSKPGSSCTDSVRLIQYIVK